MTARIPSAIEFDPLRVSGELPPLGGEDIDPGQSTPLDGQSVASFEVKVNGDLDVEDDEVFGIRLTDVDLPGVTLDDVKFEAVTGKDEDGDDEITEFEWDLFDGEKKMYVFLAWGEKNDDADKPMSDTKKV